MIRISRALEPPELPPTRIERLEAARAARQSGNPIEFRAYGIVKPQLADMQYLKCCYCEKHEEQAAYRDVEHYRPKSAYWWLTWTWSNLLFSCVDCNRQHKRERFPLASDGQALTAEQAPPGDEHPRILDPSDPSTDPMLHIEFRRARVQRVERWIPYGLTDLGTTTIEVCGLAREGLLGMYVNHVRDQVRPRRDLVIAAAERRNAAEVVAIWSRARRALFAKRQPFHALSYDAMKVLVPQDIRDRYHLDLPRP